MLEFERGGAENPTGNLLCYCTVEGVNPVQPGGDIIVCNVVVSYVSARSNHFPVVIFPPAALPTRADLDILIELGDNYDLVRMEDFLVPPGVDEDEYIRERLESFNRYVMEYVELCRDRIQRDLRARALEFNIDPDAEPTFEFPAESRGSEAVDEGGERRRSSRERRAATKNEDPLTDEASAIDGLEDLVENLSASPDDEQKRIEMRRLIRFMKNHYPRYDVHNFERIMKNQAERSDELPRLYVQKFRAIYDEAYEQAAQIQHQIQRLESPQS